MEDQVKTNLDENGAADKQDEEHIEMNVGENHAAADTITDGIQNCADNVHNGLQEEAEVKVSVKEPEKKRLFIIIGIVAALAIIIGAVFLSGGSERKLQKQLDLGQKYIDGLDYEQALASYLAAIEIDPMCSEAYIGAADAYIGMGDYENAEAVLEQGYEVTADAEIEEKLAEVKVTANSFLREEELREQSEEKETSNELTFSGSPETAPELSDFLRWRWPFENNEYLPVTEEIMKLFEPLIAAGESDDRDAAIELVKSQQMWNSLLELLKNISQTDKVSDDKIYFWTQWDGALLGFNYSYYRELDKKGDVEERYTYSFTYRPQNGIGFECRYYIDYDTPNITFDRGNISNYLYNGDITDYFYSEKSDSIYIRQCTGSAVNELLDGPYTMEEIDISQTDDFVYKDAQYYQFEDGVMQKCWLGDDGKMYPVKRVDLSDGQTFYYGYGDEWGSDDLGGCDYVFLPSIT